MGKAGRAVLGFLKHNTVLAVAFAAAVISSVLVPPDAKYADYIDVKTICCLYGTLAVVCALKNIRFFSILARKIIRLTGSSRAAAILLICITFIGSMLIANDMALITFLPLGYYVFSTTGNKKTVAIVFILQNIAANLGGMLTPFGNPQNLYLYTHFNIPTDEFMGIMLWPFVIAMTVVCLCCFLVPQQSMHVKSEDEKLPPVRTALYLLLFAITLLMVFRVLPVALVLIVVTAGILIMDRKAFALVDYGLLLTFVCFFIFAGNVGRIATVRDFFEGLLHKNTLLTALISCQCISNVPSAVLLSQFTDRYAPLLLGVNIGGVGTLIASLASLITFREYTSHYKESTGMYLGLFSLLNFGFLIGLGTLALLLGF